MNFSKKLIHKETVDYCMIGIILSFSNNFNGNVFVIGWNQIDFIPSPLFGHDECYLVGILEEW